MIRAAESSAALRDDMRAAGVERWRWYLRWQRPEVYFVRRLRVTEAAWRARQGSRLAAARYMVSRVRFQRLSERFGFTIPLGVFGPGLSIAHLGTIVVNREARVGAYCRLHPGVTIGATRGQAPLIGDDVFLGPGVGVYGGVVVGARTHVGPNVVITSDIPEDSLVTSPSPELRPRQRPTWRQQRLAGKPY